MYILYYVLHTVNIFTVTLVWAFHFILCFTHLNFFYGYIIMQLRTPCCSVFVLCGNKIVAFSSDSDSCICYNDPSCTQIASLIAVCWNCNIYHIHIKLIYVYTWHQSETSWWSVVLAHMRNPKLYIMYM